MIYYLFFFFFSSRRRHTRSTRDWSSDVCSSDLSWPSWAAACISPMGILPCRRQGSRRCCRMPASRSERRPGAVTRAAVPSRYVEAFLEMLAAERGAARLTLAAYRNDLADLAGFLALRGQPVEQAEPAALHDY